MGFQIFPDSFYPFGGIRVIVQQAFKEACIPAAVNGFDVAELQGQASSQPQTAGVGVGFIFLLPASETGNKEHRRLEQEGKDIVLEADEKGHQVDEEPQEGNPYEETADEENGVVHQHDDLAEPGHAYAEQAGTGVAPLDMPISWAMMPRSSSSGNWRSRGAITTMLFPREKALYSFRRPT